MSLESVKTIVAKAHKDPEFKKHLSSNPDEVLSGYDLTVEERGAVVKFGLGFDGAQAGSGPLGAWI